MKSIVCLVLSLLFASAAFAQNSQTVFSDPQGLFSITVPAGWRVKKQFNEGLRFEASRGADLEFEYVAISTRPLPGGEKLTSTAFANMLLNQGKPADWQALADATYSDAKIVSKGPAKMGSEDAIFFITEGTIQTEKLKLVERTYSIMTVFQGQAVTISFSAASNIFPSVRPEYERILKTVALKQPR